MPTANTAPPGGDIVLSRGHHRAHEGLVCFMEAEAILAGERFSDSPHTAHPVLAAAARTVSDRLPDSRRHLLVPLLGSTIGTADGRTEPARHVLNVQLAAWCVRQVLWIAPESDRDLCTDVIDAVDAWTSHSGSTRFGRWVKVAAKHKALLLAEHDDANHGIRAAVHHTAYAARSANPSRSANSTSQAVDAVHLAISAQAQAVRPSVDDGDALIGLLSGLIDLHRRLTGHQPATITGDDWGRLAARLARRHGR